MSLKEKVERFIIGNFNYFENEIFEINMSFINKIPIIYDDSCFIYTLLNKKIDLSNKKYNDLKVNVFRSHFDIFIYKTNNNSISNIKLILICIIDELKINEEKENKNQIKKNIYYYDSITTNFQKFIFSYIKEKIDDKEYKNQFPHWLITPDMIINKEIPNCNFTIENILLGNESINQKIKFINLSKENIYLYNLMDYFDNINSIFSPIEIDPLKINNEIFNDDNKYKEIFINTFEIEIVKNNKKNLYDLREKLIEEMPESIKELIERYEGIKFTKKMFDDYKTKKINNNNEEKIEDAKVNNNKSQNSNHKNEINNNIDKDKTSTKKKKIFFSTFVTK